MKVNLSKTDEELHSLFYALETPDDVAGILEVDIKTLNYHLFRIPDSKKYVHKKIRKRTGGFRDINAPATTIKIIQRKLNHILQVIYGRRAPVHGFVKNRSVLTNAKNHVRKKHILNLDLQNFFPSINFGRVRGMFMGKPYYLDPRIATILAQICVHNNQLPQGAPSSPIISNMICGRMDSELRDLAANHQCFYTRYADDITISTYKSVLPKDIAYFEGAGDLKLGEELVNIIKSNGFKVNLDKSRLQSKYRRQEVTGVIVNEFPNVRQSFSRQIRAMLHAWDKYGLESAESEFHKKWDKKHRPEFKNEVSFADVLRGRIEYLGMVRGIEGQKSSYYKKFKNEYDWLVLRDYYKSLNEYPDPKERGYILQNVFNRIFGLSEIPVEKSFTRNDNGEQIDGAFRLNEQRFIVEIRWRKKRADIRQLDGLLGKVQRSGSNTMGLFVSISGWSSKVVPLLKQNATKSLLLADGPDIEAILERRIGMTKLLTKKLDGLQYKSEPFISAVD